MKRRDGAMAATEDPSPKGQGYERVPAEVSRPVDIDASVERWFARPGPRAGEDGDERGDESQGVLLW